MDSSAYPTFEEIENMNVDEQEIEEEEENNNEAEAGATNKRKRKNSPLGAEEVPKTKRQTQERSWVWEHFTKMRTKRDKCNCNHCGKIMACLSSSGTSNLKKHLESCKKYKVFVLSKKQNKLNQEDNGVVKFGQVSEAMFHDATNEMLVLGELPLAFVESLAWRHFCERVKLYKPHSRRTASRDIVQKFVDKKEEMRKLIGNQRVSITTNIWVAPTTGSSYMVITAHWIDASWSLRKLIIGFKNVTDHKGKTIAKVLIECLADWKIKKVFTITVDNATANTSALKRFKEEFKTVGIDSFVLGGEFLHMRCAAHIINLVVKDGLKDVDTSVSAIRNGICYVRSSTERLKSFELRVVSGKIGKGSLPLDVKTRWNSTYLMLKKAMHFKLAFEKMGKEDMLYIDWFKEKVDGIKRIGPPTKEDWESVGRLVRFLKIFYKSTLVVSASQSVNSYKCYNEIVTIERSLISLCKHPEEAMRVKAKAMREKFDKYWDGLKEINRLIIVANVFNPTKKMHFASLCFEYLYGKGSLESDVLDHSVNQVMKRLFEEYGEHFSQSGADGLSQSQSTGTSSQNTSGQGVESVVRMDLDSDDEFSGLESMEELYKELVSEKGLQESSNELELYLKESVETENVMLGTEFNVLSWWRRNAVKYPILSEIAKDVLAMQVSSVASESAFSTSGRVLDPYRSRLTNYMIEVLMCTEQWLKSSIHLSEKEVETTIEQILQEIVAQDELEKKFSIATEDK